MAQPKLELLQLEDAQDPSLSLPHQKKPKSSGKRPGSARGIESMFRNSYRAQLSMIALAARKANILISVNGFLLSLLTFSSAYVITTQPILLIPSTLFLVTLLVSMLFAVLAARPQKVDTRWTRNEDFKSGRADILVFEQFSHLSKAEYLGAMKALMSDKERVYDAMAAHIYFLGRSANRRFNLLRVAYGAFIIGLIASAVALAGVAFWTYR